VATHFSPSIFAYLNERTMKVNPSSPAVNSIFLVKMNPAENRLKLITSSVKYNRNLPSLPSYLSQSGQRCLREAVTCNKRTSSIVMRKFGTIAKMLNPKAIEINSGLRMISL
jgi:hypothetical protein